MEDISYWCTEIGAPILSILVINQRNNRPGKGFYKLYSELYGIPIRSLDKEAVFISEYKKVSKYKNWDDLKFYLGI